MINLLWVGTCHNSPIDPAIGGTQDLRLAPFDKLKAGRAGGLTPLDPGLTPLDPDSLRVTYKG